MMTTHRLKTWPGYFQAIVDGRKTFEIRNDRDRGFQCGDVVRLVEWDPTLTNMMYEGERVPRGETGRVYSARIGFVTAFEQQPGFVVFALLDGKLIEQQQPEGK